MSVTVRIAIAWCDYVRLSQFPWNIMSTDGKLHPYGACIIILPAHLSLMRLISHECSFMVLLCMTLPVSGMGRLCKIQSWTQPLVTLSSKPPLCARSGQQELQHQQAALNRDEWAGIRSERCMHVSQSLHMRCVHTDAHPF